MLTTFTSSPLSGGALPRVLLVEDDPAVRRALQLLLRSEGYDVRAYPSAMGLSNDPEALRADCLVADLVMPGENAIDLLAALRRAGWRGKTILISGQMGGNWEELARRAGFDEILLKPVPEAALSHAVAALLQAGGSAR